MKLIKTVLLFCYCDYYSYLFFFQQQTHTTTAMLTPQQNRATPPPTVPAAMAASLTGYRQKEHLTESQSFDWTGLHQHHTLHL